MKFEIEIQDDIGEDKVKGLIEEMDKKIVNMRKRELIDKPIKEFLKSKYPNSFKTAYWMDYDDDSDFVSYLEVEFNREGKDDSKDFFNRIVKCKMFDEDIRLKHEIYNCSNYYEVRTDGIRDVDGIKDLFRKSLEGSENVL